MIDAAATAAPTGTASVLSPDRPPVVFRPILAPLPALVWTFAIPRPELEFRMTPQRAAR